MIEFREMPCRFFDVFLRLILVIFGPLVFINAGLPSKLTEPVQYQCLARLKMADHYMEEDLKLNVKHFESPKEFEKYKVTIKDGLLYRDGTLFSGKNSARDETLFVIGPDNELYIIEKRGDEDALIKHSSFFKGQPVIGAGAFRITEGRLEMINDKSGHYKPDIQHLQQTLVYLRDKGVDISRARVEITGYPLQGTNERGRPKKVIVSATKFQWVRLVEEDPIKGTENLRNILPHQSKPNQLLTIIELLRRGADPSEFKERLLRISTDNEVETQIKIAKIFSNYFINGSAEVPLKLIEYLEREWQGNIGRMNHLAHWKNLLKGI